MRKINQIVVHHSASPKDTTTYEMIEDWHKERGFRKIGYNYLIDGKGNVLRGREDYEIPAQVKGKNKNAIGICVMGNFEEEKPNPAQLIELEGLVLGLLDRFPEAELTWHKREASTLCPGKNLIEFVDSLKDKTNR